MKYISVVLALVFLLSITRLSTAQSDDCLDVSVAKAVANTFSASYSSAQPSSQSAQAALLRSEYLALTSTLSPFSAAIGIGYSNNDFYSIQSCAPGYYAAPCVFAGTNYYAEVVSYSTYGDYNPRYFAIDSNGNVNLNNIAYVGGATYYATQRPWYNANGWSQPYQFVNLNAQSQSYVIQVQSSGAHIEVDRIPTEPCNSQRSRSPATQLAPFVADQAPLASFQNLNTASAAVNAALYLGAQLQTFQLGETLVTLGVGFDNGNVIFVTDCQAAGSSFAPECSSSRYVAEVRNVAVYGNDHLHAFALGSSGAASATRDEGTSFNTTSRPWFVQGNGWTPYYGNALGSGSLIRSYATSFNGGVVEVDSNPSQVAPPAYSCPDSSSSSDSSASCPPPPSQCGSGSNNGGSGSNNDNVVINFFFADILRGVSN